MRRAAAVYLAWALGAAAWAGSPDWAKPYLSRPVPSPGGYVAKADTWVLLLDETEVLRGAGGALVLRHHQVYASAASISQELVVVIPYDPEQQTLSGPEIWVPGAFGYREMKVKPRDVLDAPELDGETVSSRRQAFTATSPIEPGGKAAVSWSVAWKESRLEQATLSSVERYPCAEWRVFAAEGSGIGIAKVEPRRDGPPVVGEGPFTLKEIPAFRQVWPTGDPWLPSPWQVLPYAVATVSGGGLDTWAARAAFESRLFREALGGAGSLEEQADRIAGDGLPAEVRALRFAEFVRDLRYRNVAWGAGAFVPESPAETLRTLSGDCKGKVVLLQALLAEAGIRSAPVLCQGYAAYLDDLPVATTTCFNHVILALDLPGRRSSPGALTEGPGAGWVLFDPTDSLAVLGLPARGLEGTPALWVDEKAGSLFRVRQRGGESPGLKAGLEIALAADGAASFVLRLEGDEGLARELASGSDLAGSPERLRERGREYFGSTVPGLVLDDVAFTPGDGARETPPAVVVRGRVESALQPASPGLSLLACGPALLGCTLEFPRKGYSRQPLEPAAGAEVLSAARALAPLPRYQGRSRHLVARLALVLPPGVRVKAAPALRGAVASPWLRVAVGAEGAWGLDIDMPRGCFAAGSETQRLKELNALCALFRQPVVLEQGAAGP